MTTMFKLMGSVALAATLAAAAVFGTASASTASQTKLLTAKFDPRLVVQIEGGDFHFLPGQIAPIHTHDAPAIGYVTKGMIIYQVEGEKPQILRKGDAFFEPVGKRILRFDNASATEEAIFVDFNLEQTGEPFIVFEHPPTEAIDRRTLPTFDIADQTLDRADVYASDLPTSGRLRLAGEASTVGLVSEGVVELRIMGQAPQRITAGQSFAIPKSTAAEVINLSADVPAQLVTFVLR